MGGDEQLLVLGFAAVRQADRLFKKQEKVFRGGSLHSSQEEPDAPVLPDKAGNSCLIDTRQRLRG